MLYSYELFVPRVCCHFRVFAPARKEPQRPSESEIEKEKNRKKKKRKKRIKKRGATLLSFMSCAHV